MRKVKEVLSYSTDYKKKTVSKLNDSENRSWKRKT